MLSVLPAQNLSEGCHLERAAIPQLTAANGAAVATHGYAGYTVRIGRLELPWRFLVADVSSPIIGADFLIHHRISVDLAERAPLFSTYQNTDQLHAFRNHADPCSPNVKSQSGQVARPHFKFAVVPRRQWSNK